MEPDYTKQLEAIVTALSRPTFPAWGVAVISGFLGVVAGAFAQFVSPWAKVRHEKKVLRQMLYADLGHSFMAVYRILSQEAPQTGLDLRPELLGLIKCVGREHANTKPDLYIQLDEYHVLETHFTRLKSLETISNFLADFSMAEHFLRRVALDLSTGVLDIKILLKSLGQSKSLFLEDLVSTMTPSTSKIAWVEGLFPPEQWGTKGEGV